MYKNPTPTVDAIILRELDNKEDYNLFWSDAADNHEVLLIKRKNAPIGWAFPGGFVDEGESLDDACLREVAEETGMVVDLLEQFFTYSDPKRDPRKHIMTTAYICKTGKSQKAMAGDDAGEVKWFKLSEIPYDELVFDHAKIMKDVIRYLRGGQRRKLSFD